MARLPIRTHWGLPFLILAPFMNLSCSLLDGRSIASRPLTGGARCHFYGIRADSISHFPIFIARRCLSFSKQVMKKGSRWGGIQQCFYRNTVSWPITKAAGECHAKSISFANMTSSVESILEFVYEPLKSYKNKRNALKAENKFSFYGVPFFYDKTLKNADYSTP